MWHVEILTLTTCIHILEITIRALRRSKTSTDLISFLDKIRSSTRYIFSILLFCFLISLDRVSIQYSSKNIVVVTNNKTITIIVGDRLSAVGGVRINIRCPFFGRPHPRAMWYFKNHVIDHVKYPNIDITEPNGVSVLTLLKLDPYHWHCILSAKLTKTHSFRPLFWRFCPLGNNRFSGFVLLNNIAHTNMYCYLNIFFYSSGRPVYHLFKARITAVRCDRDECKKEPLLLRLYNLSKNLKKWLNLSFFPEFIKSNVFLH